MKKPVFLLILLFFLCRVEGQVNKKVTSSSTKKLQHHAFTSKDSNEPVISLTSTSSHAARAASSMEVSSSNLTIGDPTIIALTERARGNDVFISNSGIVGMSKGTYGFANGHIFLRSTVATSSGSTGGTASVGTGGSLSGVGSSGPFIGLNGKSPYAGQAMWGVGVVSGE